jgi:AraC-like DNA-binding protein
MLESSHSLRDSSKIRFPSLQKMKFFAIVKNTPLSALALSLGYTSESAFSNAFKRMKGMAPKGFRDSVRAGHESLRLAPSALPA